MYMRHSARTPPGHTAKKVYPEAKRTGGDRRTDSALLRQQGFTLPFSLLSHFF